MNRYLTSTAAFLAAALGLGTVAVAQAPAPPPAQAPAPQVDQGQAAEVTESDLATFADIYVELQATASRFEAQMSSVESEQEAQELQSRMQQESVETISAHGWTPDRYNTVAQTVNSDPNLIEQALKLIEERS
jgi:hypothetical protein